MLRVFNGPFMSIGIACNYNQHRLLCKTIVKLKFQSNCSKILTLTQQSLAAVKIKKKDWAFSRKQK